MARAAVTIILHKNNADEQEVLLIKRAERLGDPWSGDMAFPGGKMDSEDTNIYQTAIRELHEEIGLEDHYLRPVGRLSDQLTKTHSGLGPMVITPFIFELKSKTAFSLNHEVTETLWIPIKHFELPVNRQSMDWKVRGISLTVPCYWYKSRRIWGLTLRMIDDLLAKNKH